MEIYNAYKDFEHGKIKEISGKKLDELLSKADRFIDNMQELAIELIRK